MTNQVWREKVARTYRKKQRGICCSHFSPAFFQQLDYDLEVTRLKLKLADKVIADLNLTKKVYVTSSDGLLDIHGFVNPEDIVTENDTTWFLEADTLELDPLNLTMWDVEIIEDGEDPYFRKRARN